MINLYNNEKNKEIKFKMDITGVDISEITPRLIIESGDNISLIKGTIEDGICKFDIPVLENLEKGSNGKLYYEVIVSDDQYSKLWEDNFEVISKTEVKLVESIINNNDVVEKTTSLKADLLIDNSLLKEDIKEEKDEDEDEDVFSFDKFLNKK